jgi:hypothetical protein
MPTQLASSVTWPDIPDSLDTQPELPVWTATKVLGVTPLTANALCIHRQKRPQGSISTFLCQLQRLDRLQVQY